MEKNIANLSDRELKKEREVVVFAASSAKRSGVLSGILCIVFIYYIRNYPDWDFWFILHGTLAMVLTLKFLLDFLIHFRLLRRAVEIDKALYDRNSREAIDKP